MKKPGPQGQANPNNNGWYIPSTRLTLYEHGKHDCLLVLLRDEKMIWQLPFARVEVSDKYENEMDFLDEQGVIIADFVHDTEPESERPPYVLSERPNYPYTIFWATDENLGAEIWTYLESLANRK